MIRMVQVNKQSVAFCKYAIAALLWLALLFRSIIPVYIVLVVMLISAFTGVHRAPLVKLFDWTIAKKITVKQEYINLHSMRFAHIVGSVFSVASILTYYFCPIFVPAILTLVLAILQTIASCGYCSAQKLYECVVCNSNCCRFGKKIRSIKKNAR